MRDSKTDPEWANYLRNLKMKLYVQFVLMFIVTIFLSACEQKDAASSQAASSSANAPEPSEVVA